MTHPTAAMIVIGDEVLSAKVRDENGAHALTTLRQWGIEVQRMVVVRDVEAEIAHEVRLARERYTYVFTSGGIGPTHDDVTIHSVARAFDVGVVRVAAIEAKLRAHFGEDLSEAHLRLAEVPEGAELIPNPRGWLAVIKKDNVFVLPGVPELFNQLFESLRGELTHAQFIGRAIWLSCDEPDIAAHLAGVQKSAPSVAIGSYPSFKNVGAVRVKVTCEGRDAQEVERALAALVAGLPRDAIIKIESY